MKMSAIMCVALALCFTCADAQVEVTQNPANGIPATFDVDAMSFASTTSKQSRLDIYAAIGYEQLSFVKKEDKFVASYEMTVNVFDSSNSLMSEKLWTEEVDVPNFDQSVSSASYSPVRRSIELPPGFYKISILCRDLESRVVRRVTKQLTVSDYSKPGLQLSDIMIISKFAVKGDKKNITPSISSNVGAISGPMHIFFEAYNDAKLDSVKFVTTVFTEKNDEAFKVDTTVALTPGKNQVFLQIDQSPLPLGDYKMYVQAHPAGRSGQSLATTSRSFVVRWSALPKGVKDLDVAIEQLTYIAKDNELDYIKEAKTPEEKQKRFREFWKKRDPNPNTVRNEKMERYYARVDYANKHFKHYTEGWRTDMGMVYIRFGPPSNVDRHPFDSDAKPYEVWSYYALNYSFVFIDQTGFGDYRLAQPIWDVWQRAREIDDGL
jgi:GWxTD domain-containing protein